MDFVGHGLDEITQEVGNHHLARLLVQLDIGEFEGSVDCDEKPDFPFARAEFGNVDMEIANQVALELLLRLVTLDLWQPTNPVALQTAVQSRSGEIRDRRLQSVETIIQRQQCVPPKRHDHSLLLTAEDR